MKKLLFMSVAIIAATLVISACGDKGSAQKQGKKLDDTYQQTKTAVKNAFTTGPAEKAGKKIDEATDND